MSRVGETNLYVIRLSEIQLVYMLGEIYKKEALLEHPAKPLLPTPFGANGGARVETARRNL